MLNNIQDNIQDKINEAMTKIQSGEVLTNEYYCLALAGLSLLGMQHNQANNRPMDEYNRYSDYRAMMRSCTWFDVGEGG